MEIRDAVPEDAPAACEVIRRSISELCGIDHLNDAVILGRWLANKTPEIVASWIVQPGNSVLVAIENGTMLALGSVTDTGEIELCFTRREVPWDQSRTFGCPRNESARTRRWSMHASQYRDGSSLLRIHRIYRGRRSAGEIWHCVELPDVEAADRTRG
jgi:hypothetical protein